MKKILLLSALLATPAFAADLGPITKAPYAPTASISWAGLYLEGYGIYGADIGKPTASTTTNPVVDLAAMPHGPGIGGALGYFWQSGNLVFGPRFDIAYVNFQGGGSSAADNLSLSNATNYLGDADAVLCLTLSPDGRLLGCLNGGFAFGGAKPNLQVASLSAAASDTSTGWNAGLGLNYALTQNWFVGIEGDYYQLGDKSLTLNSGATPIATSLTKYHEVVQKFKLGVKF
jgi:outer membrane immunogenic protein